ncbi:hypothetical protein [Salinibacter sp. 10B]|nr:hypothetical protein [Salinibacter sp. 10B]
MIDAYDATLEHASLPVYSRGGGGDPSSSDDDDDDGSKVEDS